MPSLLVISPAAVGNAHFHFRQLSRRTTACLLLHYTLFAAFSLMRSIFDGKIQMKLIFPLFAAPPHFIFTLPFLFYLRPRFGLKRKEL